MMPLHDLAGLRRLDRELAESAELARRLEEARSKVDGARPERSPDAEIVELPSPADGCADCDLELERERLA